MAGSVLAMERPFSVFLAHVSKWSTRFDFFSPPAGSRILGINDGPRRIFLQSAVDQATNRDGAIALHVWILCRPDCDFLDQFIRQPHDNGAVSSNRRAPTFLC